MGATLGWWLRTCREQEEAFHGARIRAPLAISRRCSHFLVVPRGGRHCDALLTVIVVMLVFACWAHVVLPVSRQRRHFSSNGDHLKEYWFRVSALEITFMITLLLLFFLNGMGMVVLTAARLCVASVPFSFRVCYVITFPPHLSSLRRLNASLTKPLPSLRLWVKLVYEFWQCLFQSFDNMIRETVFSACLLYPC